MKHLFEPYFDCCPEHDADEHGNLPVRPICQRYSVPKEDLTTRWTEVDCPDCDAEVRQYA